MDIQKEKGALIEMFGIHFETLYHIPPLASRILSLLIVDCSKEGITFDQLVERINASKSSVSTNLNLLLKIGKINYYTLSGDRKKYFKPSPFSERFGSYLKIIELEKEIIEKMLAYREKTAICSEELCNLENIKAYQSHVLEVETLLKKNIEKFKQIEKSNLNTNN